MRPGAHIAAAVEIITSLNECWETGNRVPADALLANYFRARRYIGSKDRGAISQLVYFILRNGATLEWWLEKAKVKTSPRRLVILAALFHNGATREQLRKMLTGEGYDAAPMDKDENYLAEKYEGQQLIAGDMPESVRFNYPDWMTGKLHAEFGDKLYVAMEAMNKEAPVDLRVNTLKGKREDVVYELDKEGFDPFLTPFSTTGIRLKKRGPVFATKAFREGWFEMQDEGSQLAAQLVQAKAGEKVIDFCAGAGGKTLAIAAAMQNKGRIYAWDVSEPRLSQLAKRMARAGVHNVQTKVIDSESDSFVKRHKYSADWVLVDAPCTGSGTWRRNPDMKWHLQQKDFPELLAKQRRILESAARLVRPGGKLVYATCSVFREENDQQILELLKHNEELRPVPYYELIDAPLEVETSPNRPFLHLYPHQHNTDGFFAAVLERRVA